MSYFAFVVAFLCIFVWQTHASTPILCNEPNTETNACKNECNDQCPPIIPRACSFSCDPGCYCKEGYSRGANGTCVLTENCPACPENEELGRRCTDTCDEDRLRCKPPRYGCFCKPGLKRINGKCVSEVNCFNCGKNEVYSDCGSACGDNCPEPEPIFCAAVCVKGCTCQENFKRDPTTNQCIPIEQCNVTCPKDSTFSCICDDSCQKILVKCGKCHYACACNSGLSRINGTCQPDSLCPK